jgi:hypothetical protein
MSEIKQVFAFEVDGVVKMFDTRADAEMFIRKPKIMAALAALTENVQLQQLLFDQNELITQAFSTDPVRRVTKKEKEALKEAIDAIVESKDKAYKFIAENADAVLASFKWPTVKKTTPEEAILCARNTLSKEIEEEAVVTWIVANRDKVLAAFEAGVEKKQVSQKAVDGLTVYRLSKAIEKLGVVGLDAEGIELAVNTAIANKNELFVAEDGTAKFDIAAYLQEAIGKILVVPVAEDSEDDESAE